MRARISAAIGLLRCTAGRASMASDQRIEIGKTVLVYATIRMSLTPWIGGDVGDGIFLAANPRALPQPVVQYPVEA